MDAGRIQSLLTTGSRDAVTVTTRSAPATASRGVSSAGRWSEAGSGPAARHLLRKAVGPALPRVAHPAPWPGSVDVAARRGTTARDPLRLRRDPRQLGPPPLPTP